MTDTVENGSSDSAATYSSALYATVPSTPAPMGSTMEGWKRPASATCWNGQVGEPGTSSISGMAFFPKATPTRWRASFISCMLRHERIAIGESDHVRRF